MRKLSYQMGVGLILTFLLCSLSFATDLPKGASLLGARAANLSAQEADWMRTGLKLKIDSFTIPADTLRPVVVFTLTDSQGQPLDMNGVFTPGTVSRSWILARINANQTQYTAYTTRTVTSPITGVTAIQAGADSGGTYTELKLGTYQYVFGTRLPANYPRNVTHTLGVYSTRNLTAWGYTNYVVNEFYHFVPDGSPVKQLRDVTPTAACNQCHNPLQAHGGSRREVLLCNMCHYPGVIDPDTGQTVDMKVMTHKIHMGKDLPSVLGGKPYVIIGNAQAVHDYSAVGFPQDIRNCNTCHQKAVQAENWNKVATRDACGSCHDGIDWKTGVGHAVGPQVSDEYCSACHPAGGAKEFDISVKGAHVNPLKSKQLLNPKFEIVSIANAKPGQKPTITFRIKDKNGKSIPVENMGRLRIYVNGPTTDYDSAKRLSETLTGANCIPDAYTRTVSYVFANAFPKDAAGTYRFSMEGSVTTKLNPGGPNERDVTDAADVASMYVAVTGDKVVPRRQIVSDAKCDACHDKLAFHGGRRIGGSYCSTCHSPTYVSGTASINMSYMTHKIHAGSILTRGYKVGNTNLSFGFPGNLADCEQCHLPNTYTLPLADGIASTITKADLFTPTPPVSTACLSCHDSKATAAHAWVNIADFGEACAACHGPGNEFDVVTVHPH